jgi:hypothetical protein
MEDYHMSTQVVARTSIQPNTSIFNPAINRLFCLLQCCKPCFASSSLQSQDNIFSSPSFVFTASFFCEVDCEWWSACHLYKLCLTSMGSNTSNKNICPSQHSPLTPRTIIRGKGGSTCENLIDVVHIDVKERKLFLK